MAANGDNQGDSAKVVGSVVLNCGVQGCCPTLNRLDDGGIEFVGDDGQKVRLNAKQVGHLKEELTKS
jgi:hypothetical protein